MTVDEWIAAILPQPCTTTSIDDERRGSSRGLTPSPQEQHTGWESFGLVSFFWRLFLSGAIRLDIDNFDLLHNAAVFRPYGRMVDLLGQCRVLNRHDVVWL